MKYLSLLLLLFLIIPFPTLADNDNNVFCQCVRYLREIQGVNIKGDAWTIFPNAPITSMDVGDVLLTTEGPGHAALIIGFEGWTDMGTYKIPQFIRVVESNYTKCTPGSRLIPIHSPVIKGIYRPF